MQPTSSQPSCEREVTAQAIVKRQKKGQPQAVKNEAGKWILPSTFKSGKRYMFSSDQDFEEYRKQRREDCYARTCERYKVTRNAKPGPKGPWKLAECPTCGSKVNKAKLQDSSASIKADAPLAALTAPDSLDRVDPDDIQVCL